MNTAQAFQSLFFVAVSPIGRGLPGRVDPKGKMIAGPWRDSRKNEGRTETDDRTISPEMIERHLAGNLLQNGHLAMIMSYAVDALGMAVFTCIDCDVAGKGHADLSQHFETVGAAMAAVRALYGVAATLGLRVWVETTKGGSKRLWIFHHRLPAADARDLGLLLLKRAGLHPSIEVFPKQAAASLTGNGVFLPYFGGAAPGRQVIADPETGETLTADEFAMAALESRTLPETVSAIVKAARDSGELAPVRTTVPRREKVDADEGERGDVSPAMWPVQIERCAYLRGLVERGESGQELGYEDWLNVATHLRVYGGWGRQEFHRLSELDSRYDEIETDDKFDSLTGGPRRCDTTPCGKDAHRDCGLPEGKASSIYFAYRGITLKMAESKAGTGTADANDPWEPPVPFTSHELPPFPLESLPDAIAGYVSEIAASTQVPVDMPSMIALSVVAAAGARRCLVQIGTTHIEPLNVYTATVMPPGSRKSATLDALTAPLHAAEREMVAAASGGVATATEKRGVEDKRLGFLRDQAAKAKDSAERDLLMQDLAEQAMSLTDVPALPRLLVDDVTPEKLASLMADQGGTMALLSAEAGVFGILAGRYSQSGAANLDLFLKAHSGESYRVDRQGRPSVSISRVCLTMCLTAQPDVLSSLADTPAFRGRGLLGRFLYSLPENLVGTRLYQNRQPDAAARRRYEAIIHALLALPEASADDPDLRHVLRLEGAALDLWAEYADETERRQAEGGDLSGICDWGSKLAGAAARIAGGMHLVENVHRGCPWTIPISTKTVAAAWAIGEYLAPHALAAYGQMGADPRLVLARRILRWIEKSDLSEFTGSQCHQSHKGVVSADDLLPGLNLLVERGFLRVISEPKKLGAGRPKSLMYQVSPLSKYPKYPK